MVPVLVEIVAPVMWGMDLSCRGCGIAFDAAGLKKRDQKACLDSYPEEWRIAAGHLSDWIRDITRLYRHRIKIRLIDAQSPLGLWKQIRHKVRKCPAFIVDRKKTYVGWDSRALEAIIDERIRRTG